MSRRGRAARLMLATGLPALAVLVLQSGADRNTLRCRENACGAN